MTKEIYSEQNYKYISSGHASNLIHIVPESPSFKSICIDIPVLYLK